MWLCIGCVLVVYLLFMCYYVIDSPLFICYVLVVNAVFIGHVLVVYLLLFDINWLWVGG